MARHTGSEVNISMLQIVLLALAREAAKKQASPAAPASALPVPVPSGVVRPCHLTPSRCHQTLQHLQQLRQHLTVFMKVKWKIVEPALRSSGAVCSFRMRTNIASSIRISRSLLQISTEAVAATLRGPTNAWRRASTATEGKSGVLVHFHPHDTTTMTHTQIGRLAINMCAMRGSQDSSRGQPTPRRQSRTRQ